MCQCAAIGYMENLNPPVFSNISGRWRTYLNSSWEEMWEWICRWETRSTRPIFIAPINTRGYHGREGVHLWARNVRSSLADLTCLRGVGGRDGRRERDGGREREFNSVYCCPISQFTNLPERALQSLQSVHIWHPWPLTSHRIRRNSQEIEKKTFTGKKGWNLQESNRGGSLSRSFC